MKKKTTLALVIISLSLMASGLVAGTQQVQTPKSRDMVQVPAGEFTMGSDTGENEEKPVRRVYLDAFQIDKCEVTVKQYTACLQAGKCSKPDENEFKDCNWGKSDRDNHPINCVDWNQSKVYCEFVGKRLPTEAEWEKAARGTDGRIFPWGNKEPTCHLAVFLSGGYGCGKDSTWPVGSKPSGASPYGAMDMAGNVWEWVADWYDENYYQSSPNRNPAGPGSGKSRVLRGGGYGGSRDNLRSSTRFDYDSDYEDNGIGIRCAKTP